MAHVLPEGAITAPDGHAPDGRWSDFWTRFWSAAILGPVALAALCWGGPAWTALMLLQLAVLGYEWGNLAGLGKASWLPAGLVGSACAAVLFGFFAGFLGLAAVTLFIKRRHGHFAAAGVPYAGICGLSLIWLRNQPGHGLEDTLFLVTVVWGTDIGAYAVGRVFGGKKLAPRISPGKTWSGGIGGFMAAGLTGAAVALFLHGNPLEAALAAGILSLVAQAGDLLESAIKRHLGVKDSGDTIPGHGGLFDRVDGFLTAAPVAALFLVITQGGVALWP